MDDYSSDLPSDPYNDCNHSGIQLLERVLFRPGSDQGCRSADCATCPDTVQRTVCIGLSETDGSHVDHYGTGSNPVFCIQQGDYQRYGIRSCQRLICHRFCYSYTNAKSPLEGVCNSFPGDFFCFGLVLDYLLQIIYN